MITFATEILDALTSFNNSLVSYITSLIGVSSIVAAIFPKPDSEHTTAKKIHKYINMLACNLKHAKNNNVDE